MFYLFIYSGRLRKSGKFFLCLLVLKTILFSTQSHAQISLPGNFQDLLVDSNWSELEGFRFDATGQMYVWEKAGKVWVVDTNGVKQTTALLDISPEVGNWRDHGLNGFALDPDFRNNGYYYLFYTVDRYHILFFGLPVYNPAHSIYYSASIARVTRYTANPSTNFTTTLPNSRLVLIGDTKQDGIPILHESHSGGQLVFGTDGSMLVSTGDGGSYNGVDSGSRSDTYYVQALNDSIITVKENVGAFRAQLVDCLNGKILRIDPATGNGLSTNPYYDSSDPRGAKSRVWAVGLRNPFRMTLRPGTGQTDITAGDPGVIYIGDVGWQTWEDLHVIKDPGENLGWPLFEGLTRHINYQNSSPYNLDAPNPLYNGGSCNQPFFRFSELLVQDTLASPSWQNPCNPAQQIPASLYRFKHSRPDFDWKHGTTPQARTGGFSGTTAIEYNLTNPASPVPGPMFNGAASVGGTWYIGTKYPLKYQNTYFQSDYVGGWIKRFHYDANNDPDSVANFGSGMGPVVFVEYNPKDENLYYVNYPSQIRKIRYNGSVNNPPLAVASQNILYGTSPLLVQFTGGNSSDPENLPLTYNWNFGDGGSSILANPSHNFVAVDTLPHTYTVTLTVTDNIGQTSVTTVKVYVNNTPPQVSIISFTDGDLYTMSFNTVLPLVADVTDAEHTPNQLFYEWKTFLHHNVHVHIEATDTNKVTSAIITPEGCNGEPFWFEIQLKVTDAAGLSTTVSSNIYPACDPPVADFIFDSDSVCRYNSVHFNDFSSNLPDSWDWIFPGGSPSVSNSPDPIITYNSLGVYDVTLIVASTRGTDTLTIPGAIHVISLPPASVSPSGTDSVCSGVPVLLIANAGSQLNYQWLRNGIDIPGATSQTYNATAAGTYKVEITKITTGCEKVSATKKIVYRSISSSITADGPTTFCAGDSVILSAPVVQGYVYQWIKAGTINISGAIFPDYTAKTQAKYKVRITDSFGCTKTSNVIQTIVNCRMNDEQQSAFNTIIPNPASHAAQIMVNANTGSELNISIFDLLGKKINNLVENYYVEAGEQYIDFDVSQIPNGVYLVKVFTGSEIQTIKMVVNHN